MTTATKNKEELLSPRVKKEKQALLDANPQIDREPKHGDKERNDPQVTRDPAHEATTSQVLVLRFVQQQVERKGEKHEQRIHNKEQEDDKGQQGRHMVFFQNQCGEASECHPQRERVQEALSRILFVARILLSTQSHV